MSCTRMTPFSRIHEHLLHSYVGPYDTPILVRMSRSEVPTACYQAKARNVFLCIYKLSSTVDNCGSNVASALSDSKYTRVPLAHARPFVTCHVNNTVIFILLSRSNDEWTCIYARGIGTISGHNGTDRTCGRKQVLVKSSQPNVDAGKESKLPLNQNRIGCLFMLKAKLDSDAIPSTFLTLFRC